MLSIKKPVLETIPSPLEVHSRLGYALREVELLRRLLRLARRAEQFRKISSPVTQIVPDAKGQIDLQNLVMRPNRS